MSEEKKEKKVGEGKGPKAKGEGQPKHPKQAKPVITPRHPQNWLFRKKVTTYSI